MIEVAATSSSSQWATQREILKKFEDRKFLIPKSSSMDSNLNLEGIERPEFSADSLSLKSGAATNKIWMTGYSYDYDYTGSTATGIMGISTKAAGGIIKGRLVIEPVDENTINLALVKTSSKLFNEDVMDLWEKDVVPGREVSVGDKMYLEKPMQIKIVSGKVESVAIGKEEPLWVVNFKRALAAQIQIQLDRTSSILQPQQPEMKQFYAENSVYHTLEGSVTGECQTWYHISRLPEEQVKTDPELVPQPELCEDRPVYEIIKNRDLDKCRILPVFQYNSIQGLRCNTASGSGCHNKISHVDTVKITGCTSKEGNFIVQSIKSMDQYVDKSLGYETEASEGLTMQSLTLESIKKSGSRLSSQISSDVHHYETLAYAYDEEYKTQGPFMGKPDPHSINSPMVMQVDKDVAMTEAQRLHSEIVADLESQSYYVDPASKQVSAKINMMRRALSNLELQDLKTIVDKLWQSNKPQSTSNQILVDVLSMSGTNPSMMLIRDMILKGRIVGEQAVNAIASRVASMETPTKEMLKSFMELLESDVVVNDRQLKITSALSMSRLVYQACINSTVSLNMYPKLVMGEFCSVNDDVVTQKLVPWLTRQLNDATDVGERIAMLIALGNIGHEMILPSIVPYMSSCEPSTAAEAEFYERNQPEMESLSNKDKRAKWLAYRRRMNVANKMEPSMDYDYDTQDMASCNVVRTKAIFALSNLALAKEDSVGPLLMPIAFNKEEQVEVRLAALSLLFVSNPPAAGWNALALSTWWEPNDQVSHFIYTTITSLAMNKDPVRREVAVRAEAVVPLMKPMFWTSYIAHNYIKSGYEERSRLGYTSQTIVFPGYESLVPSNMYQSLSTTMGPWLVKVLEMSVASKHAEKFIDRLVGKPGLRGKFDSESQITSPELNQIHEELKIVARGTGQPEMYVYVNVLDNYQRFLTINPTTLYKTFENQMRTFRGNAGRMDVNIHRYFPLMDAFRRVPSSMGLAYTSVIHHSALLSLKSQVNGGVNVANFNAEFSGEIKPVVVLKMTTRLMVETPWAESYPTTGVDVRLALALPGKFSVQAQYETGKVQSSWEFLGDKLGVAKYSVKPFTTIRKIHDFTPAMLLDETESISYLQEPAEKKYVYGEDVLGMKWELSEFGDVQAFKRPMVYAKDWFGSLLFTPTLPQSFRHAEWSLKLDNSQSETDVVKTYVSIMSKNDRVDVPTSQLHAKSLFKAVYGEQIKSESYVGQSDVEWSSMKFGHIFQSLSNPSGVSLDLTVELTGKSSEKIRRFGSSIVYGFDAEGNAHRASWMVEREQKLYDVASQDANFVMCVDIDARMPSALMFKRREMIPSEVEHKTIVKAAFGKSCTDDRKITVVSQWSRSEMEISRELMSKVEETKCRKTSKDSGDVSDVSDECVSARRISSRLNKNVVTITYNDMPDFLRNATVKVSNVVRHLLGAHMEDNQVGVDNKDNEIRIESVYYPLIGSLDVHVHKPESNTFYDGIAIHPLAESVLPQRMAKPRPVFGGRGVCTIGEETVTTFDGLRYNASVSGCAQLVTKDCSGRYKMAVLVREEQNKKIVTVLLDTEKIELRPASMKVKINDMEMTIRDPYLVKDSENKVLAIIQSTADGFIKLESPSHLIAVHSDEKRTTVSGSALHRGRLCGLCGNQDGDKANALRGPMKCSIPVDLMDVAYELKYPSACRSDKSGEDVKELRRVQQQCYMQRSASVFGVDDMQPIFPQFQQSVYSSKLWRPQSLTTILRNKMVDRKGRRCFSTVALPKCKEGSRPVDIDNVKVGFHCVAETWMSKQLSREMLSRPLEELRGKLISFTQMVSVPTSCSSA